MFRKYLKPGELSIGVIKINEIRIVSRWDSRTSNIDSKKRNK